MRTIRVATTIAVIALMTAMPVKAHEKTYESMEQSPCYKYVEMMQYLTEGKETDEYLGMFVSEKVLPLFRMMGDLVICMREHEAEHHQ